MSLLKLFFIFVKIGAILLGGGYVILPVMQNEFAEKRHLVSGEDLVNYFALSQSLPGIIAANMTMFVGYKLRGFAGAIIAMVGIIFVPFWCIVLLASLLSFFTDNVYIQGALWGISVAVIALIFLTSVDVFKKSEKNLLFYMIFLLALTSLLIFKLSPIQTVLFYSFLGILSKIVQRKRGRIK